MHLQQDEKKDIVPREEAQRKKPFKHQDAFLELRTPSPEKKVHSKQFSAVGESSGELIYY